MDALALPYAARNQLRRDIPDATTEVDAIGQLMVDGKASLRLEEH